MSLTVTTVRPRSLPARVTGPRVAVAAPAQGAPRAEARRAPEPSMMAKVGIVWDTTPAWRGWTIGGAIAGAALGFLAAMNAPAGVAALPLLGFMAGSAVMFGLLASFVSILALWGIEAFKARKA